LLQQGGDYAAGLTLSGADDGRDVSAGEFAAVKGGFKDAA
jgi:hypothetical protein